MSGSRRGELLCGIGAFAWGLLALFVANLQPYDDSNATATNVLKLHPGFTAIEVPIIIAVGLPVLGIALGAVANSLTGSRPTRLLLWAATVLAGIELLLGVISALGVIVAPGFLLGLWASFLARNPQTGAPDAIHRAA